MPPHGVDRKHDDVTLPQAGVDDRRRPGQLVATGQLTADQKLLVVLGEAQDRAGVVPATAAPAATPPAGTTTAAPARSLVPGVPEPPEVGRGHINTWTNEVGSGAVLAYNPLTGETVWKWETYDVINSGVLTTATDLVFVGSREGYYHALDTHTGQLLWRAITGGNTLAAPITYEVDGQQLVAIASGHALFVFGLRS